MRRLLRYLLRSSRVWIRSLDRSSLGGFAADSEALSWMDVTKRLFHAHVNKNFSLKDNDVYLERLSLFTEGSYRNKVYQSSDRDQVAAELYFWWSRDDSAPTLNFPVADAIKEWMSKIVRIHTRPDFRVFYEADIWDDAFIARCITDGLDASMAQGLLSV